MSNVALGWELLVERGPGWLFVRPAEPPPDLNEAGNLADYVWALLQQNFTHRVVLELDRIGPLTSTLIGQLVWLQKRIHTEGGLLRICGLSPQNHDVLHICRLDGHLPEYPDRASAVMTTRPMPR
jgi:anti-anti-sigma factor